MIPTLDSVTAEFFAFRQAFFAAGGHRKAVKYPSNLRAAAVALLRATPDFNIGPIAKSLGIGYGALRDWHTKSPVRPVQSAVARQSFIPVKILAESGSCSFSKRLEKGTFKAPTAKGGEASLQIAASDLALLIEGVFGGLRPQRFATDTVVVEL